MAQPSSRQELIDYCLRQLGAPVLEINVAEEQIQDLMDDAIQYFNERHYDGVEKALQIIKDETLIENNNQKTFLGDKIETLKSKISIIWGENDEIIPNSHIKELPSNVETHIFKESGHMSHIEKSKEVNEIIVKSN